MSKEQSARTKILPLESLRGICATLVILNHLRPNSFLTDNAFIYNLAPVVDFFFVLSGFVIMLTYHDRIRSVHDIVTFQKRRFWRLWPLHFTMLMVFAGFEVLKYLLQAKGYAAYRDAFTTNNLTAFINNIFLTHSILPAQPSFNIPSWSISVEFYTYIIFAVALLFSKKRMLVTALALALISAVILYIYNVPHPIVRLSMFRCTYAFFAGVALYIVYKKITLPSMPLLVVALAILLVALITAGLPARPALFFVPLFALFILLIISLDSNCAIAKYLSNKRLVHLGTLSYSIYMVHYAVLWVLVNFIRHGFKVETSLTESSKVLLHLPEPVLILITIFAVVITLATAQFTYTFIESRFRKK